MVAWRSLPRSRSSPVQMCLFRKQLNFSSILTFGLAVTVCFMVTCSQNGNMVSCDQNPRMRPKEGFFLVGQEITLCCLGLVSSDDTIDPRNASFTCPNSDSLMSQIYTAEEKNEIKICINVTISSTHQRGFCVCVYGEKRASTLLQVNEPPSIAEKDLSCLFYDGIFQCSWPPPNFLYENYLDLDVELQYQATQECRSESGVSEVSCQIKPPCNISNISGEQCCYNYNVSLKMVYITSVVAVPFVFPWEEFYLPWISKYPTYPVKVKDRNATCITLGWRHQKTSSDFDIIQFEYISHWEPSKVETLDITIEWPYRQNASCLIFSTPSQPDVEKNLCGLTPFTQYEIKVRIRPSTSHVWSDPYSVKEKTTDYVPARPPPTISGAFRRISNNESIVYWKLLSEKEWQSDQTQRSYRLFSEEWQLLKSLDWNVSQTKIPLHKEQDTIIKFQAHNQNGYAENYTEITIPFKGPPVPDNVTAEILEAEEEVRISWISEFNEEVVLFWCIGGKEYECQQNSINWRLLKTVSSKSATLHIEDVNPSINYMFGVSVSHFHEFSGIKWTNCSDTINELKTFRSNCGPSVYPVHLAENGSETLIITIIVSTFAILIVACVIFAVVSWWRKKWRRKSELLDKPSRKMHHAKSDTDPSFENRDEHTPSEKPHEKNFENVKIVNEVNEPSESSTGDNEKSNSHYHRFRMKTSSSKTEENDMDEINVSGHFSSNSSQYNLKHQRFMISDHQKE